MSQQCRCRITGNNAGQKRAEDINLIIPLPRDRLILYGSEHWHTNYQRTVIFSREKKNLTPDFSAVSPEEIELRADENKI